LGSVQELEWVLVQEPERVLAQVLGLVQVPERVLAQGQVLGQELEQLLVQVPGPGQELEQVSVQEPEWILAQELEEQAQAKERVMGSLLLLLAP
jgi:hypothetical protein